MQRLDKFLSSSTTLSRSEVLKALMQSRIIVNGVKPLKKDQRIDENNDVVVLDGNVVEYKKYIYLMLNKPQGVVSATSDKNQKTVLDLVGTEYKKYKLFPCGRLDKDTTGLVILTNDGVNAHRLLSPKNHVKKVYEFKCIEELSNKDVLNIQNGVKLKDEYITKHSSVSLTSKTSGFITLTEGKYHEIKRIFGALHNKITYLKRVSFGDIKLDVGLNDGEYRELTKKEIMFFTNQK